MVDDELVLSEHHVGAVLLGAGRGHDDRGRALVDPLTDLGPGELIEEDRVRPALGRSRASGESSAGDQGQGGGSDGNT